MENTSTQYEIAKRELNEMAIFDEWLERKEQLETAKERFNLIDKPFRKALKELFDFYGITRLENDYIDIQFKKGYTKTKWDDDKLKMLIYSFGMDPKDYMTESTVEPTLQLKYKD